MCGFGSFSLLFRGVECAHWSSRGLLFLFCWSGFRLGTDTELFEFAGHGTWLIGEPHCLLKVDIQRDPLLHDSAIAEFAIGIPTWRVVCRLISSAFGDLALELGYLDQFVMFGPAGFI
jgi:hypothetical protein